MYLSAKNYFEKWNSLYHKATLIISSKCIFVMYFGYVPIDIDTNYRYTTHYIKRI